MNYFLKKSPFFKELIDQMAKNDQDELSYELWRNICIRNGWIEINIQQDQWVSTIKDETKRELVKAYNNLNQNLKWNSKKKEKRLFRKNNNVISYENDLNFYWDLKKINN